jgi:hypothetical protein
MNSLPFFYFFMSFSFFSNPCGYFCGMRPDGIVSRFSQFMGRCDMVGTKMRVHKFYFLFFSSSRKQKIKGEENGFGDVAVRVALVVGCREKDYVNREHKRA